MNKVNKYNHSKITCGKKTSKQTEMMNKISKYKETILSENNRHKWIYGQRINAEQEKLIQKSKTDFIQFCAQWTQLTSFHGNSTSRTD